MFSIFIPGKVEGRSHMEAFLEFQVPGPVRTVPSEEMPSLPCLSEITNLKKNMKRPWSLHAKISQFFTNQIYKDP